MSVSDRRRGAARIGCVFIGVIVLILSGCSSASESSTDANRLEPPASDAGTSDPAPALAEAAGACPDATDLRIVNSVGLDGSLDISTEFADVTLGETADLVFATYEIPEDPQFGVSAPVGDPMAPEGGTIFQVDLFGGVDSALVLGDYVDDDAVEPRIMFIAAYHGSERINPLGAHTVTLTEITDEHLCGTVSGVGDTGLQSLPYVEGTFVVPVV